MEGFSVESLKQRVEFKHGEIMSFLKTWAEEKQEDLEFAVSFTQFMYSSNLSSHPRFLKRLCLEFQSGIAIGGMLRKCEMSEDGFHFVAEVDGREIAWTISGEIDLDEVEDTYLDMLTLTLEFYMVLVSTSVEKLFTSLNLVYPIPSQWWDLPSLIRLIKFDPNSLKQPNNLFCGKSFYVETIFTDATHFILISFGGEVCEKWDTDRIGYEIVDFNNFDDHPDFDRVYCDPARLVNFVMSREAITTGIQSGEETFDNAVSEEFMGSYRAQVEARHGDIMNWTNLWLQEKYGKQEDVLFAVQLIHFVAWCDNFDSEGRVAMKWKRLCLEWERELIKADELILTKKKDDGIDFQADVCGMRLSWTIPLFKDSDITTTYGIDCDMVESTMVFYQELLEYTLKEVKAKNAEQNSVNRAINLFDGEVFYLETDNNPVFGFLLTAFGGEVRDYRHSEGVNFEVIDKDPVYQLPGVGRSYSNSNWIICCIQDKNTHTPPGAYPAGKLVPEVEDDYDDGFAVEEDQSNESEVDDQ